MNTILRNIAASRITESRDAVGRKVSIIDDDESMRVALIGLVRSLGYEAHGFASAEEFLASGHVTSCACVVTDVQMPGMSGIDLKVHLSKNQLPLPVIMITGRDEPGLEKKAAAAGATCFLRKPFEAEMLAACLKKALG
jgi:FixJ family two-component response regulator